MNHIFRGSNGAQKLCRRRRQTTGPAFSENEEEKMMLDDLPTSELQGFR